MGNLPSLSLPAVGRSLRPRPVPESEAVSPVAGNQSLPSLAFGVTDWVDGVEKPRELAGRVQNGLAIVEIRGAGLSLSLKGFTPGQLDQLRDVAQGLACQLREAKPQ